MVGQDIDTSYDFARLTWDLNDRLRSGMSGRFAPTMYVDLTHEHGSCSVLPHTEAGTMSSSGRYHFEMPTALRIGSQSVERQIDCENCQMH